MKKTLVLLFLLLCISIPVILPFFHAGYFPTHDGEWAVVRLTDMFRTIRDFQIPPRYSGELNFGYGYPLFNFTYPMPYYLGILIYAFGTGFVGAIKILFAGSVVLSAIFMFFAARTLWKNNLAGIISATLYVYFPYRMVDLYVRGSIGESLSFVLFPLLFYLAIKLTEKRSLLLIGGIGVSVAFLIMTHNIMTVLFLPVYVIFIFIQTILKNKKAIKPFFLSIILGFGLSAFFWIPAIFEKGNVLLSKIPIANRDIYFITFKQLIFPKWGYGVPTDTNGFSYQLGLVHLVLFIIVILSLLFLSVKNNYRKEYFVKIALSLTVIAVFYIFLLFKSSEFLWKNLPLISEINYPWIVLGVLGFLISLLAGLLTKQIIGRYAAIVFGIVAIILVLPYAKPERYINYPDNYYLTNDATTTSSNELMPLWVKKMPLQRAASKVEIINGSAKVENLSFNSKNVDFSVSAQTSAKIMINKIYYPGWKVSIDKNNAQTSYNNQGVMEIAILSGEHVINATFEETPLRLISDILSVASFIILAVLILQRKRYAIF
jgi:hypothetical protein